MKICFFVAETTNIIVHSLVIVYRFWYRLLSFEWFALSHFGDPYTKKQPQYVKAIRLPKFLC